MYLKPKKTLATVLALSLSITASGAIVLLAGCGGTRAASVDSTRSNATITILWPTVSRLIPDAANSITVRFVQGTTTVGTQTATRPTSGNQSILSFARLPVGVLTVTAQAFPSTEGTGVAQASMSTSATIVAGQTTTVSITMASTIDHLTITPVSPSIAVGGTVALTMTALDASGNIVLTSPSKITWLSLNPAIASVSTTGVLTGVSAGSAQIQVTEVESGKTAAILVSVNGTGSGGNTAAVATAAMAFAATLTSAQQATLQYDYTLANAQNWTNLAVSTRNGVMLGSLNSTQTAAAKTLLQTALSAAGYNELEEIRLGDEVSHLVNPGQSWGYGLYYIAFIGTPSSSSRWMLQITGHHVAYNITYNGGYISATPLFLGSEPTNWTDSFNRTHAPNEPQRAAVSALAAAIQADGAVASAAKLSGTFTDVVMGPTGNGDTGYPQSYPSGTVGRGVLYSALSLSQKSQVKAAIEAWVNTQATDVASALLGEYESEAALSQTYIGYGVGASGEADFSPNPSGLTSQSSYLRIDGPRVWIEFVTQPGLAYPSRVHYNTLWRDKNADYGSRIGPQ